MAINVYKKLEYLFNYSTQSNKEVQCREPRGTLVIMDRTFDLVTPLIHDYSYEATVFDYLEIPEDGSLDKVIPPEKVRDKPKSTASENSHKLSEKDTVWQKYKTMHIAEVLGFLNDEIKGLRED